MTRAPYREAGPPRGILHAAEAATHRRILPSRELAPAIAHFWHIRWDLEVPRVAETLPHPTVHLVFEHGDEGERAEIAGVPTRRFVRTLRGRGWVFGIKFRPAAFAPLWPGAMSELTDRVLPIAAVFGPDGQALAAAILGCRELEAMIEHAEAWLRPRIPTLGAELEQIRDLVERLAVDRALLGVDDIAQHSGLGIRTLQRQFRRHVGVGPKWVVQRYRLHEAAARLAAPDPPPLARLAAELGYADQAHFARDFADVVGMPPTQHLRRAAR